LSGADLSNRFPDMATSSQYWIRSGIAGFAEDAKAHFYLPERYTDPFGQITTITLDRYDLLPISSTDPLGNTVRVEEVDYRVLAPTRMLDINNNQSRVVFDTLGLPAATAVMGKDGNEGDNLDRFGDDLIDLPLETVTRFFANAYDETEVRRLLGNATARHVYWFGEEAQRNPDGSSRIVYGKSPACAAGLVREVHVTKPGGQTSKVQAAFEYTDGGGSVIVKKVQAEPATRGGPLRWIASGLTIVNNKGKPVKQYEPYFSPAEHRFEEPREVGVTPVMYYDAAGRLVRTELPDGGLARVEFTPWHVTSFDPNDTVLEPQSQWFERNTPSTELRTRLTQMHAGTPSSTFLDSLGREVVSVAHNRVREASGSILDEKYLTFTKLDAEGKPLWIRDARGNLVMQYINPPVPNNRATDPTNGFVPCYDIAGNLLFQHSMDAGDRWMLPDATGKPLIGWDSRGQVTRTTFDALRRPTHLRVKLEDGTTRLTERIVYGESLGPAEAQRLNLRGQAYLMLDGAGLVTNDGHDFKGNPQSVTRYIAREYKTTLDWESLEPSLTSRNLTVTGLGNALTNARLNNQPMLDPDYQAFTTKTEFDALNRLVKQTTPDGSVFVPTYNQANLLEQDRVNLFAESGSVTRPNSTDFRHPDGQNLTFVTNIDYDAKGQRTRLEYGNGIVTEYEYDPTTFRLKRMVSAKNSNPADPAISPPNQCLQDLNYTYDPVGNITEIRNDAKKLPFQQNRFFNNQVIQPNRYEYDALYRLTNATGREHATSIYNPDFRPTETETFRNYPLEPANPSSDWQAVRNYEQHFTYDPVGNIMLFEHNAGTTGSWTRRYRYDTDSNRLTATSNPRDAAGVFSQTYRYNVHGSMITMPHLPVMTWNHKEQLIVSQRQEVNTQSTLLGERTYYTYDSSGQRVRKVTERQGGTQRKHERVYVGGFEVYREFTNAAVTLERETLHASDNMQTVMLIETQTRGQRLEGFESAVLRYQLNNHLGSSCVELDRNGAFLSFEEYHPYGTTAFQVAGGVALVSLKRYRYTGMEKDEETGLNYHSARYLLTWLIRWSSSDPSGVRSGINLFSYSSNNPILFSDQSGLQAAVAVPPERYQMVGASRRQRQERQEALAIQRERAAVVSEAERSRLPSAAFESNRARFNVLAGTRRETGLLSINPEHLGERTLILDNAAGLLISLFTDSQLIDYQSDPNLVKQRLNTIIDIAKNRTAIGEVIMTFGEDTVYNTGDSGFRAEFRDLKLQPGSGDQIGHFLGAVRAAYSYPTIGVRQMLAHEFENTSEWPDIPLQKQFASNLRLREEDVQNFQSGNLDRIPLDVSQFGVSYQDLYLTFIGLRFGSMVRQGRFTTQAEAARWLQIMLTDYDLNSISPSDPFYQDAQDLRGMLSQYQRTQTDEHRIWREGELQRRREERPRPIPMM
jgi:RHS repeat-associated protein